MLTLWNMLNVAKWQSGKVAKWQEQSKTCLAMPSGSHLGHRQKWRCGKSPLWSNHKMGEVFTKIAQSLDLFL